MTGTKNIKMVYEECQQKAKNFDTDIGSEYKSLCSVRKTQREKEKKKSQVRFQREV